MAVAFAAGIAASDALGGPPSMWYVLLVLTALTATIARRVDSPLADLLLVVGLLIAGMAWHSDVSRSALQARLAPTEPETPLPFTARISEPPVRHERSWTCVAEVQLPPGADSRRAKVRARVTLPAAKSKSTETGPRAGELWLLRGSVEPFPRPRNPGEMDFGAMLSLAGVEAVVRARDAIRVDEPAGGGVHAMLGRVQSQAYAWIDRLHIGDRAAFLKGILLGYRADLAEDLKSAFLITGTVHILAVSGGNVALIAMVVLVLAGLLRLPRRSASAMAVAGVLFYAWVTGSSPSVVRASIMAIVVLAAGVTGRRVDIFQSLAIAALILLVLDPRNLFDVGFQLSFLSVLAIVIGAPMLEPWLNRLPEEFRDHAAVRAVVQLMAVSAAAQAGTLPLTMSAFGQVSIISVAANIVVVPLSGVALVLGVIEILVMPVWEWAASVYAGVNDVVMDLLLGLVRVAASIPMAAIEAVRLEGWSIAAVYAILGVFASSTLPDLRRALLWSACLFGTLAVWGPVVLQYGNVAEVITIDVGQGDAHLVRTSAGSRVLVDAGPSELAAERYILPLLDRLGIEQLDDVIITHGHRDHSGGLNRLLDRVPVRTLTLGDSAAISPELRERARVRGTKIRIVGIGDRVEPDSSVRMYVLHPGAVPLHRSLNDRSVVLRLLAGESSMLLTGDLEENGEAEVMARYGPFIRSELLKVAHHGSNTGTTANWVDIVRPRHAIISVGRGNSFGHPDADRLAMLRLRGVGLSVTMEEGAVWFTTDGRRWNRRPWRRPDH